MFQAIADAAPRESLQGFFTRGCKYFPTGLCRESIGEPSFPAMTSLQPGRLPPGIAPSFAIRNITSTKSIRGSVESSKLARRQSQRSRFLQMRASRFLYFDHGER